MAPARSAVQVLSILGSDEKGNPPGPLRLLKDEVSIVTPEGVAVQMVWPGLAWDTEVRGPIDLATTTEPKNMYITEVAFGSDEAGDNDTEGFTPHLWGTLDDYVEPEEGDEWPPLTWRPLSVGKLRKTLGNTMQQQVRLKSAHAELNREREKMHKDCVAKGKMIIAADFETPLPCTSKYARWERSVIDPDSATNDPSFVEVAVLSDNVWKAREEAPKRDRSVAKTNAAADAAAAAAATANEEEGPGVFMNAKGQTALFEAMEGLDNGEANAVVPPARSRLQSTKPAVKSTKRRVVESDSSEDEGDAPAAPAAPAAPVAAVKKVAAPKGAAKAKPLTTAANKKRVAAPANAESDATAMEWSAATALVDFYESIKRRKTAASLPPIVPVMPTWPSGGFDEEAQKAMSKTPGGIDKIKACVAGLQLCAVGGAMEQVRAVRTFKTCLTSTQVAAAIRLAKEALPAAQADTKEAQNKATVLGKQVDRLTKTVEEDKETITSLRESTEALEAKVKDMEETALAGDVAADLLLAC